MNSTLETKKTVTRTVSLSNGAVYTLVDRNVDSEQVRRMVGDARCMALSHEVLAVRQGDGSTVYINPNHIVSVTFAAKEDF